MQTPAERRTGTDRSQFDQSSAIGAATEPYWNNALPGFMTDDSDVPYDPYDPYWEPVKGQDDD